MKRYIFGALLLVPLVALGYAIKQKDDGSLCFEKDSVDEWCISSTGNVTFDGTLDLAGEADGLVLDADGDTTLASDTDDQIDIEIGGSDEYILTPGVLDLGNGTLSRLDLDADNDTSIRSSADDQMDFELNGTDHLILKGVAGADSGATTNLGELAFSTPVDTTGTNVHQGIVIDAEVGNASGGTNTLNLFQIDDITGDAEVSLNAVNIGNLTGTGAAENGIVVGTGWDVGIDVSGTPIDLDADNDTSITADTDDQVDLEVNGTDVLSVTNDTGGAHAYVMEQAGTHSFDRNVVGVWDDFLYQTIAETDTPWVLNAGGDAQAIDPAINAQEGGVIRATTGDADGTVANDGSQLISHVPMQADSGGMVFETRLHINSAVTDISVCAGFTDTTSLEEPFSNSADTITSVATDAVAFCYDTDATTDEWWALGVDSDTDATGNAATGTAPTADTYQVLRIEIDSDGESARLYIDGALEVSLTANVTANSVDLHPMVIANATTTTSKTVDVDYIYAGTTR